MSFVDVLRELGCLIESEVIVFGEDPDDGP